jgi:uncharacterized PurR-regulated membrane protein YhhQ (DUF165 family)
MKIFKVMNREYLAYVLMFSLTIVAANILYSIYGVKAEIPIILFLIPIDFVVRDKLHQHKGFLTVAFFIGAIFSFLLADPSVALASVLAFSSAFLGDTFIYTKTNNRLSSNIVGSILDTIVFAVIAMGSIYPVHILSIILKILGSVIYDFLLFNGKLRTWRIDISR